MDAASMRCQPVSCPGHGCNCSVQTAALLQRRASPLARCSVLKLLQWVGLPRSAAGFAARRRGVGARHARHMLEERPPEHAAAVLALAEAPASALGARLLHAVQWLVRRADVVKWMHTPCKLGQLNR